jgi:hypothetical protein
MTEDSDREDGISGPFGTAPLAAVNHGVVAELSQPIKYTIPEASDDSDAASQEPTLNKDFSKGSFGIVDPRLTPEEQTLDAERRSLRAKFLDPIPIPNQPIHQQYIFLANTTQHHKVRLADGLADTHAQRLALFGIHPGEGELFPHMRFLGSAAGYGPCGCALLAMPIQTINSLLRDLIPDCACVSARG